jgi:hypothetical protein
LSWRSSGDLGRRSRWRLPPWDESVLPTAAATGADLDSQAVTADRALASRLPPSSHSRRAMRDERDLSAVVGALLRYLRANPHACDTAEGIRRWWFAPDVQFTEDAVARALEAMHRDHLLEVTTAVDGHQRYRRQATDEELDAALRGLDRGDAGPGESR